MFKNAGAPDTNRWQSSGLLDQRFSRSRSVSEYAPNASLVNDFGQMSRGWLFLVANRRAWLKLIELRQRLLVTQTGANSQLGSTKSWRPSKVSLSMSDLVTHRFRRIFAWNLTCSPDARCCSVSSSTRRLMNIRRPAAASDPGANDPGSLTADVVKHDPPIGWICDMSPVNRTARPPNDWFTPMICCSRRSIRARTMSVRVDNSSTTRNRAR